MGKGSVKRANRQRGTIEEKQRDREGQLGGQGVGTGSDIRDNRERTRGKQEAGYEIRLMKKSKDI